MACSRTAFGLSEFSQSMSDGINDESIVAATAVAPGGPTSSPSRQIRRGSSWNRSGRLNNERKVLEDPLGILLGHLHEQDPVHDSAEQASRDLVSHPGRRGWQRLSAPDRQASLRSSHLRND